MFFGVLGLDRINGIEENVDEYEVDEILMIYLSDFLIFMVRVLWLWGF